MKIAIMGGWNLASGASIHSELLGRELAKRHDVSVMSFYKSSFHGLGITKKDEDYVTRCFTKYGVEKPSLNPTPFIEKDYDFFIVEDLGMLPIKLFGDIFPKIKKRAKTINVIHDGKPSSKKGFYNFDWDAIVCFDKRYEEFLKTKYPKNKIHVIPYPSAPIISGDKEVSREKLNLPKDKKIIFLFGRLPVYLTSEFIALYNLAAKYDILLLAVSNDEITLAKIKKAEGNNFDLELRKEYLDFDKLYQYLHACDALIFPKTSSPHVVVSSTIFQCLGSLCPILAYDSNFVSMFSDEIFKYKNNKHLEFFLTEIFEQKETYKKLISSVKKYLEENSSVQVAQMFEELFLELKR